MHAPTSNPPLLPPPIASFGVEVFVVDQVLGRGDEIVEYVLFRVQHSTFVPFLAVFAAAAQIGDRIDAATFFARAGAKKSNCDRECPPPHSHCSYHFAVGVWRTKEAE
jgi:hypothetical protein